MREHDFRALFKTATCSRTCACASRRRSAPGVPFPAAAHARDLLIAAVGRGHGEDDYASMVEAAEGLAGRRL